MRAANLRLLAEREHQRRGFTEMQQLLEETGLMFGWSVYVTDCVGNKKVVVVRLPGGKDPRVFPVFEGTGTEGAP